jgi:LysM repeat protein
MSAHHRPIRLTRRGRIVVIVLALAAIFAIMALVHVQQGNAADDAGAVAHYQTVTVQPGQTLWSIARSVAPQRNVQSVIFEIRQINRLASADISAGQQLVLPPA